MQRMRAGAGEGGSCRIGAVEIVTEISATASVSMTILAIVVVVSVRWAAVKTFNKI